MANEKVAVSIVAALLNPHNPFSVNRSFLTGRDVWDIDVVEAFSGTLADTATVLINPTNTARYALAVNLGQDDDKSVDTRLALKVATTKWGDLWTGEAAFWGTGNIDITLENISGGGLTLQYQVYIFGQTT